MLCYYFSSKCSAPAPQRDIWQSLGRSIALIHNRRPCTRTASFLSFCILCRRNAFILGRTLLPAAPAAWPDLSGGGADGERCPICVQSFKPLRDLPHFPAADGGRKPFSSSTIRRPLSPWAAYLHSLALVHGDELWRYRSVRQAQSDYIGMPPIRMGTMVTESHSVHLIPLPTRRQARRLAAHLRIPKRGVGASSRPPYWKVSNTATPKISAKQSRGRQNHLISSPAAFCSTACTWEPYFPHDIGGTGGTRPDSPGQIHPRRHRGGRSGAPKRPDPPTAAAVRVGTVVGHHHPAGVP